ncbi:MAG: PilZ domain-containing protein [Deltaproteobacteria bacterium]|nr:PilZ domain-containing protein [Deltaproteobacteria bacterium]
MKPPKEKRNLDRIIFSNLYGEIELKGLRKEVSIVNASEDGLCVTGIEIPIGTVVRLDIEPQPENQPISLYCRAVWSSTEEPRHIKTGLYLLHTNKILFKQDLASFSKLVAETRKYSQV